MSCHISIKYNSAQSYYSFLSNLNPSKTHLPRVGIHISADIDARNDVRIRILRSSCFLVTPKFPREMSIMMLARWTVFDRRILFPFAASRPDQVLER
jgi:hypothetical protein